MNFEIISLINKEIEKILEIESDNFQIIKASKYMLLDQGKRIRPLIILLGLDDLKVDIKNLISCACAIEILHTSTLVHDDLPALDNDDYRRGKESCHKKFGEATAILTGDFLEMLAIKLISETSIDDSLKVKLIQSLSKTFLKICYGQELDIISKDINNLTSIHSLKTASLFATCFEFIAILSYQDSKITKEFIKFGNHLGMYFQILDDYLDCFGDQLTKGRPASSDIKNKKQTIFLVDNYNKEEAINYLNIQYKEIETNFTQLEKVLGIDMLNLQNIIKYINSRIN